MPHCSGVRGLDQKRVKWKSLRASHKNEKIWNFGFEDRVLKKVIVAFVYGVRDRKSGYLVK